MATWKALIEEVMMNNGESWSDVEVSTLTQQELNREFPAESFGSPDGVPFTIWTRASVYFPLCHGGYEWVGRVARHPDGKPTPHFGLGF